MSTDAALSGPFTITVDYDAALDTAIDAGNYDEVADEYHGQAWNEWKAPDGSALTVRTGKVDRELVLLHLGEHLGEDHYPDTDEIITLLGDQGLVAATLFELLALGRTHSHLQREFPIYELGSVWVRPSSDGPRYVGGLVADFRLRRLGLSSYWIDQWPPQMRMLASRA